MKRAKLNYVVDAVIAGAFLVCALSGIVFLLPDSLVGLSNGQASVLGLSLPAWNTLHEWSGLVMIGGVVLHTLLHARWIAVMTRKIFGSRKKTAPGSARAGAVAGAPVPENGRAIPVAARPAQIDTRPAAAQAVVMQTETPGSGRPVRRYLSSQPDDRRDSAEPRISRRAFLAGAAGLGVIAVAGGLLGGELLKGDSATQTTSSSSASGDTYGEAPSSSSDGPVAAGTGSGSGSDPYGNGGTGSAGAGSSGSPSSARVVVDQTACTGCGACLQACPAGVFAFSNGKASAAVPDACRFCCHCVRSCPAAAITIDA